MSYFAARNAPTNAPPRYRTMPSSDKTDPPRDADSKQLAEASGLDLNELRGCFQICYTSASYN